MKRRNNRKNVFAVVAVSVILCGGLLTGCSSGTKSATEALEEGDYAAAASQFEEAAQKAEKKEDYETATDAYRGLGMAYYEQEEYENARTNLQKALDLGGTQTPVIYNMLGVCGMRLEDYGSARTAFETGIALASSAVSESEETDYTETLKEMKFNRVICCEKSGDWAAAKEAAQEYMTEYPDDTDMQHEWEFLQTR
jgi:tetratricopeptide (TPR) repeat protein